MSLNEIVKETGSTVRTLASQAPVIVIMSLLCGVVLYIAWQSNSETKKQLDTILVWKREALQQYSQVDGERAERFLIRLRALEDLVSRMEFKLDLMLAQYNRELSIPATPPSQTHPQAP